MAPNDDLKTYGGHFGGLNNTYRHFSLKEWIIKACRGGMEWTDPNAVVICFIDIFQKHLCLIFIRFT